MPGDDTLKPARFSWGQVLMFRTTPGLIFFYSYSRLDFSDMAGKGLTFDQSQKMLGEPGIL